MPSRFFRPMPVLDIVEHAHLCVKPADTGMSQVIAAMRSSDAKQTAVSLYELKTFLL
jgi:hypothetical protein